MKMKSMAIVAAMLGSLAIPSFAMADRHGGGSRGHGGYSGGRGYGGHGYSYRDGHRGHGGSDFVFSFGIGALFTPSYSRPHYVYESYDYAPVYRPVYYSAPPVVYERACEPAPVVYYSPAPRYYYNSCYSGPTYYRADVRYYYHR